MRKRPWLWQFLNVSISPAAARHHLLQHKEVSSLAKVKLRENESQEQLLRRFRKAVVKSQILTDVRRKRWFISKSELKRIEKKKAERRVRRRNRTRS